MKQRLRLGIMALLVFATFGAGAEVAYVAEGVKLGVHQQASRTSTILTLVPASTPLEVLERRNDLVKVRLSEGTEGWVDGRYLTQDLTPSQKTDGLEAELTQTASELAKARELAAELEYQLNREKERAEIMEADLLKARRELQRKSASVGNNAETSAGMVQKLSAASEENRRLKKRIEVLEAELEAAASDSTESSVVIVKRSASSDDDASLLSRYTAITEWQLWEVMLLFFGLLLAFAVGAYVVDWEVRRRHGGFRV